MANAGLLLLAVHDYIRTRIGVHHVHRDLELRIKGHLYEIANYMQSNHHPRFSDFGANVRTVGSLEQF